MEKRQDIAGGTTDYWRTSDVAVWLRALILEMGETATNSVAYGGPSMPSLLEVHISCIREEQL